jgi:radical SAM protein with 4Fe4S-binding SPASM domain
VLVSMNVDMRNYQEFRNLLHELKELYQQNPLLQVCPHQLMPDYLRVNQAVVPNAEEAWYQQKLFDLKKLSQTEGFLFQAEEELPSLRFQWCEAAKYGTAVIMPDGKMVKCPEQLTDDQVIGNVIDGITNEKRVMAWRQFADYERCRNCELFPYCSRIHQCASRGRCYEKKERMSQFLSQIERFAEAL